MQTRYEYKFFLEYPQYQHLKQLCEFHFPKDTHYSKEPYPVHSLYLDTKDLHFFNQKVNGEYFHHKIRLRQYEKSFDLSSPCFLELKTKRGDCQIKKRKPLNRALDWQQESSFWLPITEGVPLMPVSYVLYFREAFETLFDNQRLRITFDHNLSGHSYKIPTAPCQEIFQSKVLMEIKFNKESIPEFLYQQIKNLEIERTRFSKYATINEALY